MASTASTRLRLNKQGTGDSLDSWGSTLNTQVFDLLDEAIAGTETIALTGVNYTLSSTNYTSDESRNASFRFTGTGGVSVIYPSVECFKGVRNDSSAAIIFGYSAGSGVTIPAGGAAIVQGDASTMRQVVATVSSADLSALFQATSTDTETIASSGDITFTLVESSRAFAPGMLIRAAVTASPGTNYVTGYVKTYSGTTLVMTATASTGSGSYSAWTITFDQATVGLPSQSGNANSLLGTDGSAASWYPRATEAQAQTGTDTASWCPPLRVSDAITYQALKQGLRQFFIPASSFVPRVTNGPSVGVNETSTNDVMFQTLDFDQTTSEGATWIGAFPKSWNNGTITFTPYWTASAGSASETVDWAVRGMSIGNDDVLDTAYGTEQTSSDVLIATGDLHIGPTSSAITIAGSPADGDVIALEVKRNVSTDNLAADAKLIGVMIAYTISAATDA